LRAHRGEARTAADGDGRARPRRRRRPGRRRPRLPLRAAPAHRGRARDRDLRRHRMPETPSTQDDHPAPGDLSVVFSAAPDPAAEGATPQSPEPTGWPWFLPQDGLRPEDLDRAADLETDPAGAAATLARIPLVHGAVELLEHVGDGHPLTPEG